MNKKRFVPVYVTNKKCKSNREMFHVVYGPNRIGIAVVTGDIIAVQKTERAFRFMENMTVLVVDCVQTNVFNFLHKRSPNHSVDRQWICSAYGRTHTNAQTLVRHVKPFTKYVVMCEDTTENALSQQSQSIYTFFCGCTVVPGRSRWNHFR